MFWIICAVIAAIVVLAILAPFMRRRSDAAEPAAAYDLRVYRDQLREVERDLERGVIEPADAERLRIEIGRKVLEADRALTRATSAGNGPGLALPVVALAATVAGAAAIYWAVGVPGMPDAPIVTRIAQAEQRAAERPPQSRAEAMAAENPRPAPQVDPDDLALIQRLRDTVAQNPDDAQGLRFLAQYESALGNGTAARQAQQHLVEVLGDQATPEEHSRLAALMIDAAGGTVTPEAEDQILTTLESQPSNAEARYMLGLLQMQTGRPDRAFPIWAKLLDENPDDAPWSQPIRAIIGDLAWFAGEPDYQPPASRRGTAGLPGPDQDALDAAEGMTDEDRQQMVSDMVARLESRLATEGGTPDEWARLISSLVVIGRTDQARAIWQEAQTRFAATPDALQPVNDAAARAGLVP